MRILSTFLLALLPLAHQGVQAQEAPSPLGNATIAVGPPKTTTTAVAWSYNSLQAGVEMFERSKQQRAPGASMRFMMPKGMLPAKDKEATTATIAVKGWSVPLELAPDLSFVLPRNQKAREDGAYVVVSRQFPSGLYQHPIVVVRSPGLADNVLRLGDLRLACEIQVRILKKDMLRARLLLEAMSLFGKSPCESDTGKVFDAPALHNSLTYTAGKRKEVKLVTGKELEFNAPLGDEKWPDNTLITFALDGEPAPPPAAPPPPKAESVKPAKARQQSKPIARPAEPKAAEPAPAPA
ncbi:MAG: hypothetical protein ABW202_00620, partial [Duganella sp.]